MGRKTVLVFDLTSKEITSEVGRKTVLVFDLTFKEITSEVGRKTVVVWKGRKTTRAEASVTNRFNINLETSVCRVLLALDPAVVLWSRLRNKQAPA